MASAPWPHFNRGVCREGAFVPEVRETAASRLQGRAPSRQGVRDLQVEPAFQGAPALNLLRAAALGILRAGGARNPHVLTCTLRFLRSGVAQPAFARDARGRFSE